MVNIVRRICSVLLLAMCVNWSSAVIAQDHVTVRARIVCNANVVTEACDFVRRVDHGLFVVRDFVLYCREKNSADNVNDEQLRKNPVDISVGKLGYSPRVFAAPLGCYVRFLNPEKLPCDPQFHFFENVPFGFIPSPKLYRIRATEPFPVLINDLFVPSRRSYAVASTIVGISNEDGDIVISEFPTAREVILKVFHPDLTTTREGTSRARSGLMHVKNWPEFVGADILTIPAQMSNLDIGDLDMSELVREYFMEHQNRKPD